MRETRIAVVLLFVVLAGAAAGEVDSATDAKPTLEDLSWLAGTWRGEGLGGEFEEHWTTASAGTMLGVFRLAVDGKVQVIEFTLIAEEEERIALRFKHFRPDYSTWEGEQPLDFTLVSVTESEAVFLSEAPDQNAPRRISYSLLEDGSLVAEVAGSDDEGSITDSFELRFTRD